MTWTKEPKQKQNNFSGELNPIVYPCIYTYFYGSTGFPGNNILNHKSDKSNHKNLIFEIIMKKNTKGLLISGFWIFKRICAFVFFSSFYGDIFICFFLFHNKPCRTTFISEILPGILLALFWKFLYQGHKLILCLFVLFSSS